MQQSLNTFLFFASVLLPGIGITATVLLAAKSSHKGTRALLLFLGPILTFLLHGLLIKYGGEAGGNLLTVAIIGLFLVALFIYYPVLLLYYAVRFIKSRRK